MSQLNTGSGTYKSLGTVMEGDDDPGVHKHQKGDFLTYLDISPRTLAWPAFNMLFLAIILVLMHQVESAYANLFVLYYQPFFPMLAMLWFWAVAVLYFEWRGIRYDVCFSIEDQKYLLPSHSIFHVCYVVGTLVLASGTVFLYQCTVGNYVAASYQPPFIYLAMLGLFLYPGNILFPDTRRFFASTIWRVFTPLRSVTWSDFLLADILTSLAKAISDTERAVCHLMTGPVMTPDPSACGDASWIIPFGLALPYAWRLIQCLRVYADTGARPQIWNAIKYSTAFPVIALSATKYHVDPAQWQSFWKPLWLASAALNSGYSYFWDLERDWEIGFFSQMRNFGSILPPPVLQSHLLYPKSFYLYLMASNFILRQAWTYKLSPHLRRHHLSVFTIVILEAFRRFQWLFVRVEVELRKIQARRPELGSLVALKGSEHLHDDDTE